MSARDSLFAPSKRDEAKRPKERMSQVEKATLPSTEDEPEKEPGYSKSMCYTKPITVERQDQKSQQTTM